MAEPRTTPRDLPAGGADEGKQLGLLLETTQAMLAEEYQRAERIEAKSRNQFTVVGAFFAVVMATTAGILNFLRSDHQKLDGWVLPVVGALAAAAIVAICFALGYSMRAWRTREKDALDAQTLRDYVPYAEQGNVAVAKRLIEAMTGFLDDRRAVNRERVDDLKTAAKACAVAALVAAAQLCSVFVAIILQ